MPRNLPGKITLVPASQIEIEDAVYRTLRYQVRRLPDDTLCDLVAKAVQTLYGDRDADIRRGVAALRGSLKTIAYRALSHDYSEDDFHG